MAACPVASSEDLSSSNLYTDNNDINEKKLSCKKNKELLYDNSLSFDSCKEYAIDMQMPPILSRLPNLEFWKTRLKFFNKRKCVTKNFLNRKKKALIKRIDNCFFLLV